jgi:archaellum component FlaG (FlaF/FlaG flagellin family)
LSKKGSSSNNHITLSENGEIINDPAKVSEVFNDFFINVAKNTSIHLLIKNVIGSTIQGIDSFSIVGDIPS